MRQYTAKELKAEFERLGYSWPVFHLIGIRSNANAKNQFDDLIGVVEKDNITWYTCTTNPGTNWLQNLLNPKGAALLKPGQWDDCWQVGLHQGKYEALTQCKPVTVYRDGCRGEQPLNQISQEDAIKYIQKGVVKHSLESGDVSCVSGTCEL